MRRLYAVGVSALLAVALLWMVPGRNALVGKWETVVELGESQVVLRYEFSTDGTYTCAVAAGGGNARLQGNYRATVGRLYLSQDTAYAIDTSVYDRYTLDGDTLTLLDSSGDTMAGFYPLTLQKVK